ncbi:hypothetical protein M0802_013858 [Mischocyttarus mexicanus]|nr:hypothetical protein M0802_013858 [Mischocyttarus mexicanus]
MTNIPPGSSEAVTSSWLDLGNAFYFPYNVYHILYAMHSMANGSTGAGSTKSGIQVFSTPYCTCCCHNGSNISSISSS